MAALCGVKEGWDYFAKYGGAAAGADIGDSYIARVEEAIQALNNDINAFSNNAVAVDKLKGFIAEVWHADTFNLNAVLRDAASRAVRNESNQHASADVTVAEASGKAMLFSMKYYAEGKGARGSAAMQAKNVIEAYYEYRSRSKLENPMSFEQYLENYGYSGDAEELYRSIYYGQGRIIPSDQMDEAISYLTRKMNAELGKEGPNRAAVYENYKETLEKLSDRIKDSQGVESFPLTKEEAEVIAALTKEEGFNAADFGIGMELITREYVMKQAVKAGYTSAVITLVLQIAPEIYRTIDYLIKNGEIDPEELRRSGWKALSATASGFIRGSVSCGLTVACQSGKLGRALMGADSAVIGAITVLAMDTMKFSFDVARGKMAPREMGAALIKEIIVSAAALGGGIALQAVVPVVGYLLGSFLGSIAASAALEAGERVFLSFCADTGFSCFGLVDQDYELPPDVLEYIGIDTATIRRKEISHCDIPRIQIDRVGIERTSGDTIDIMVLRRGVVAVNKIAYII